MEGARGRRINKHDLDKVLDSEGWGREQETPSDRVSNWLPLNLTSLLFVPRVENRGVAKEGEKVGGLTEGQRELTWN